jgi:hypothetical protein
MGFSPSVASGVLLWRCAGRHGGSLRGTASFGTIAATLVTMAALVGDGLLAAHVFKRRIAGIMIGVHATLAVSGFVILVAFVFSLSAKV